MAARPRTLPAAIAPVLVGTALAGFGHVFHPLRFLAALLGAIFIQVGTNLSNDYSDARRGADADDRLGPVRVVYEGPRDDGALSFVQGSVPEGVRLAWDFRDETWAAVEGVVRVNDPGCEPFRYLRLREPPYSDDELRAFAASVHDPAYVYVRHEHEPTAPAIADRLRALF